MNVEHAALIRYDLCHRSRREELLDSLRSRYNDDGERYGESVFGGPRWDRYKFEGDLDDIHEGFTEFEHVETFVGFQPRHLIDIVSVVTLSESQIEEISGNHPNRTQYIIDELTESVTKIANEIPTVAPTDFNHTTVQLYIEPSEAQPVLNDEGDIDPDHLSDFLTNSRDELERWYYNVDHPQSLLQGNDLVTPHFSAFPWGRLTVFNLTAPPSNESGFEPIWLRRLRPLREYLRTYLWFNHRLRLLAELDQETHGIGQLMQNAPSEVDQLTEILEIESSLDEIRETWTDRYTKTVDEVADLESRPPLRTLDSQDNEQVKIDEIIDGSPVNSLLDIYNQHLSTLSEQVTSDLNRIGNKLDEVSNYIQDKVRVRSTAATIRQQRATNYLTVGIIILTIVLVVVAIIELFWVG